MEPTWTRDLRLLLSLLDFKTLETDRSLSRTPPPVPTLVSAFLRAPGGTKTAPRDAGQHLAERAPPPPPLPSSATTSERAARVPPRPPPNRGVRRKGHRTADPATGLAQGGVSGWEDPRDPPQGARLPLAAGDGFVLLPHSALGGSKVPLALRDSLTKKAPPPQPSP